MSEVSTLALSTLPNKPKIVMFHTGDMLPMKVGKHIVFNQNGVELVGCWEALSTVQHAEGFVPRQAETSTKLTVFEGSRRVSVKEMFQCQNIV